MGIVNPLTERRKGTKKKAEELVLGFFKPNKIIR